MKIYVYALRGENLYSGIVCGRKTRGEDYYTFIHDKNWEKLNSLAGIIDRSGCYIGGRRGTSVVDKDTFDVFSTKELSLDEVRSIMTKMMYEQAANVQKAILAMQKKMNGIVTSELLLAGCTGFDVGGKNA